MEHLHFSLPRMLSKQIKEKKKNNHDHVGAKPWENDQKL